MQRPGTAGVPIEAMIRESESLAYFEAFLPARITLEAALRAARTRADRRLEAICLDRIGLVLDFEGRSAAGAEYRRRAQAIAEDIRDQGLAASIQASAGLAHWRQAEYAPALDALRTALTKQEQLGDRPGQARTLVFLGRVHFKKAEYARARETYRRAAAIFLATTDRRWLSIVLEDLGDVALEQGFFVEALEHFERALGARRDDGDMAGEAYMLNVIGRTYLLQAAHREAFAWFERAAMLSRRHDNRPTLALALYHMGIARDGLADPAGALELYAEALALKETLGDRRQQAWILSRMGHAHVRRRDVSLALERYARAIRIWEEIGDPRGLASGLSSTGQLNLDLGRYEASLEAYRRAGELLADGHPAFLAPALSGMGRVYAAAGDGPRALEYGRRAVEIARSGPDDVGWSTRRSLAWIERRLGDREAALASYRESLRIIEALRGRTVASPAVRADFLEGKQTVYGETVDLLFELGRIEEAFEVAERSRTRAFLEHLAGRAVATRGLPGPVTLPEARRQARRTRSAILEYFSARDRLFIWLVGTDGSIAAASAPIPRHELSDIVATLRQAMVANDAGARPLLRRLHRILIGPMAHLLPADREALVTIVPHGPLFLISFGALLDDRDTYLVERHTLTYSPSIGVMHYTGTNRDRARLAVTQRTLLVGNPAVSHAPGGRQTLPRLPGAEHEVRAIAAMYPAEGVSVLTGSKAGERAFRAIASRHTTIHLATHAVVFDDAPLRSYLVLAPEQGGGARAHDLDGDGLLTVAEVFGLELRAELVTLSACDTGLGHVSGDGVAGLSHAFIYAGAASVMVSLWRIADDIATIEMQHFYRDMLRSGGNKAGALATAQREMIAMLRNGTLKADGRPLPEAPLFWAAFVLLGEGR